MTFTYGGDPSNSDREHVRFLVGDTDSNDALLEDAEIDHLLSDRGSVYGAAAAAAKAISAKFARRVTTAIGKTRVQLSDLQDHYKQLAKELRRQDTMTSVQPFAGGISDSDKDTREADSDRVEPAFTRDLHETPGLEELDDLTRTNT